jgi:glutamate dehydrogenase/leucine dehydrogenase
MNMGEEDMRVFVEANGSHKSATGKPANMCAEPGKKCGIPHEFGSTGFGVFHSALVAMDSIGMEVRGATVAIEGLGNVGSFAAKYFSEAGARLVAISDSRGVIHSRDGIELEKLSRVKKETGSVVNYRPGNVLPSAEIAGIKADILVTAAVPDLINESNVESVKARLVVEGSNIPATPEIEGLLHERSILVVPDFVANAGGVISSYAEYRGLTPKDMFSLVEKKIRKNTETVLKYAKDKGIKPRDAAMEIARDRVLKKCKTCRIEQITHQK